jgi:hypothetical protein
MSSKLANGTLDSPQARDDRGSSQTRFLSAFLLFIFESGKAVSSDDRPSEYYKAKQERLRDEWLTETSPSQARDQEVDGGIVAERPRPSNLSTGGPGEDRFKKKTLVEGNLWGRFSCVLFLSFRVFLDLAFLVEMIWGIEKRAELDRFRTTGRTREVACR